MLKDETEMRRLFENEYNFLRSTSSLDVETILEIIKMTNSKIETMMITRNNEVKAFLQFYSEEYEESGKKILELVQTILFENAQKTIDEKV